MPRISGVEIPVEKRVEIALTYIYGIGRKNVQQILKEANISGDIRSGDLTDQEVSRLQKAVSSMSTEGVLKKIVSENIKRLKQIGAYRGMRHSARLPARGQRTRANARTKRGKRATVGAMKKDNLQKMEKSKD
ncbi:30S ribosomal protein S13 [Patescibacteria group bacterium]